MSLSRRYFIQSVSLGVLINGVVHHVPVPEEASIAINPNIADMAISFEPLVIDDTSVDFISQLQQRGAAAMGLPDSFFRDDDRV